jgi:hypothetical protein
MLGQKVDIFIMAGKRKQLSNDIKNVIVEMHKSGHKLQEIADTLNIPRGTVSDVVIRFKRRHDRKSSLGRWTNTISGLDLVLFPPNINPIIVSNDHLTFV